jgi:predicted nucleic acid-binding protein
MILVDTSVWIDYFRGFVTPQSEKLDTLLGVEQVFTGDLILTEVLQGFVSERDFNRKTIDTLIATSCIEKELSLLYSDRDFDPFVQHLGLRSAN